MSPAASSPTWQRGTTDGNTHWEHELIRASALDTMDTEPPAMWLEPEKPAMASRLEGVDAPRSCAEERVSASCGEEREGEE